MIKPDDALHLLHMNSGFLAEIDAKNPVQLATQTCSPIFANQMDSMSGIKFNICTISFLAQI